MAMMNKEDYVKWCQNRALALLEEGNLEGAFRSFLSDMNKYPDTRDNPVLSGSIWVKDSLMTEEKMRDFIEGFS